MVAEWPLLTNVSSYYQPWSNGSDVFVDIISEIPEVVLTTEQNGLSKMKNQVHNYNSFKQWYAIIFVPK